MIPTMILFGLLLGRWWKSALLAAAVVWPLLLVFSGVLAGAPGSPVLVLASAAGLAVLNCGVGVALHQAILWLVRAMHGRRMA